VMSSDYFDALGLVRTEELLAADRYYGTQQFWTRVCDYGFSKTKEEALDKWGHDRVLGDVVRVVRMMRPLAITSVFVGGRTDGQDRKSTRLNSSHGSISYAVFCLQKKNFCIC